MKVNYKVASCSWPDHLVFGQGDGSLRSIEGLARRMNAWKEVLGAEIIHWREIRTRRELSTYYASPDNPRTQERIIKSISWDDFEVAPSLARERGMKAYLYFSFLDEGRPLPPEEERRTSYHNVMHGQHVTWQTDWSRDNPEYTLVDRSGIHRQWGVLCYGYPEVQDHMMNRILSYVENTDFQGVFLCTRSQCKPSDFADQFGFNPVIVEAYKKRYGTDIMKQDFDLPLWNDLLGETITQFIKRVSQELHKRNLVLSVGIPRGDVFGPPFGNWTLQWRFWVQAGLVDELVIDQNSSRCPSMWHDLWPMHRGYGYIQNYLTGKGMLPLEQDILQNYLPIIRTTNCKLFIARQWHGFDSLMDRKLLDLGVDGLVFSTFRFDNPEAIRKGDFRA